MGEPIKIVDQTSTRQKHNEIQNFESQKIVRTPVAGKSQSTPLEFRHTWGMEEDEGSDQKIDI